MQSINNKIMTIVTLALFSSFAVAAPGSSNHSAQASKHSALAGSHMVVGTAKVAASVVALPLIVVGAVGAASAAAGSALLESAQGYEPLEVTDIVITQDPSPTQAMQ
ncbi:MAG: hypothetical protein V7784_11625 [Oceanospirillaceae bacterium]